MLVRELQSLLAEIYAISVDEDIRDFLVTDARVAGAAVGGETGLEDEMLLVREDEAAMDVALYLDEAVLGRLSAADPCDDLHTENLDDYCRVLEGVSHFVYLVWRARNDRQVTQFELEMQAEVDKYLSARLLLEAQGGQALRPEDLVRHLFADVRYHAHLDDARLERYRRANDLASRYCRRLERRFPAERVSAPMVHDLRQFYRLPQAEKLSHIHAAQFA